MFTGFKSYKYNSKATKQDIKFLEFLKEASIQELKEYQYKQYSNKSFPEWKLIAIQRAILKRIPRNEK